MKRILSIILFFLFIDNAHAVTLTFDDTSGIESAWIILVVQPNGVYASHIVPSTSITTTGRQSIVLTNTYPDGTCFWMMAIKDNPSPLSNKYCLPMPGATPNTVNIIEVKK